MKAKVNEVPKKYSINSSDLLPRKKLSSFERDASEEIDPNAFQLNPLSTKFYSDLLRLEEKVSSKNFDIETLNEIVSLYAVLFEFNSNFYTFFVF